MLKMFFMPRDWEFYKLFYINLHFILIILRTFSPIILKKFIEITRQSFGILKLAILTNLVYWKKNDVELLWFIEYLEKTTRNWSLVEQNI